MSISRRDFLKVLGASALAIASEPLMNYLPPAERYATAQAEDKDKNQVIYRDVIKYYEDGTYERIDDMHIRYNGKVYDNFWKMVKDAKTPEERKELLMHPPYVNTNMKFFVMPKEFREVKTEYTDTWDSAKVSRGSLKENLGIDEYEVEFDADGKKVLTVRYISEIPTFLVSLRKGKSVFIGCEDFIIEDTNFDGLVDSIEIN
jgi:hypothetical protein